MFQRSQKGFSNAHLPILVSLSLPPRHSSNHDCAMYLGQSMLVLGESEDRLPSVPLGVHGTIISVATKVAQRLECIQSQVSFAESRSRRQLMSTSAELVWPSIFNIFFVTMPHGGGQERRSTLDTHDKHHRLTSQLLPCLI
jgi:hypothetical protein